LINNFQFDKSAQEKGLCIDKIIPLSLLLEKSDNIFKNLKLIEGKLPEWWNKISDIFEIKKIIFDSMINQFKIIKWDDKNWVLPTTTSGNDGAIFGEILVLTGDKSSFIGSVSNQEVKKNFEKSNISNLYKENTTDEKKLKNFENKQNIINNSKEKIKGIIRLHIILPKAATSQKEAKSLFVPGIRVNFIEDLKIYEVIIDIDSSNLLNSELFSKEATEFLLINFIKNKKRKQSEIQQNIDEN
jgi:hypothetical protein